MEISEKKQYVDEFKIQWKSMWRNRLDDKVRAEGIADRDYSLLSVDRGTVIIATRSFKTLDFYELLQQNKLFLGSKTIPPNPVVGGWGKFVRTTLVSQNFTRRGREVTRKPNESPTQQMKKGGRGWLHSR